MTVLSGSGSRERPYVPWTSLLFAGCWFWAIWSCAEHWRGNPNYSFGWAVPLLALGFGLRRYWTLHGQDAPSSPQTVPIRLPLLGLLAFAGGALVFSLEFARQRMWHPQIVLELICLLAIAVSFGVFYLRGGVALVRAQIFPVLFFMSAVPWPARFEQPITSTLMRWVAAATAEILHWIGVEAQTSGGAIALRHGLVGITEACSGVRSLQAGIMFGLAMGEWFLLRPVRRIVLLAIAVGLALATNLARTIALSLQAEWHGVASVENVHDLIGNITVTTLIAGIWIAGKFLSPPSAPAPLVEWREVTQRVREFLKRLLAPGRPEFAAIVVACLIGFVSARGVYAAIESRTPAQTVAFFTVRSNAALGDRLVPVPGQIWNELRPTTGEYIRRESAELPRGAADFYHFFWKPSPWNRFALVHRPDICMPGVGWQPVGAPDPIEIDFDGRKVRCSAFRFRRGEFHALQLWGVWRNGDPVSLDYEVAQVLGDAVPPPSMQFEGKSRSATEIVACSLISELAPPSAEIAVALLRSVFQYEPK